jgi:uncharacterized damage-inducible protein DinB
VKDFAGLDFMSYMKKAAEDEQKPRSKAEIIQMLREGGDKFATFLEGVSDDFLAETVTLPGAQPPTKSRFEMLLAPKEHEMHHRSQLMLMERMLGIVPHLTREWQTRMAAMQAGRG